MPHGERDTELAQQAGCGATPLRAHFSIGSLVPGVTELQVRYER